MAFYTYIVVSGRNGTLYVGSTDDLPRRIKEWRRSWKLLLIEAENPTWRDLFAELNLNA